MYAKFFLVFLVLGKKLANSYQQYSSMIACYYLGYTVSGNHLVNVGEEIVSRLHQTLTSSRSARYKR